jgi:hypothetical protein
VRTALQSRPEKIHLGGTAAGEPSPQIKAEACFCNARIDSWHLPLLRKIDKSGYYEMLVEAECFKKKCCLIMAKLTASVKLKYDSIHH